jgi:hypothetical protein
MHPFAKWFRFYTSLKLAAVSIPRILGGLVMWFMALFALVVGVICCDTQQVLSVWNSIAAVCVLAAVSLIFNGTERVMNALPGITPMRISDAPGRSRFANRKDLRRHRII